jgi:CRP-like cAMP-binding protein
MSTRIDPDVAYLFAQNVGAKYISEPIPPAQPKPAGPSIKLDAQIVKKIADSVAIFAGMPHESLLRTLDIAELRQFKAASVVFNEGDVGKSFYVIIVGAVSVQKKRDGQDVVVARMGAGECFGEMALVRDDVRTATVVAERDCAALCFERERIDAYPQSAHLIYKNIAAILANRLEERSGHGSGQQRLQP